MHAADADDHAACVGCLDSFDILGHRERRPGAVLGPPDAGPMASARRTPLWEVVRCTAFRRMVDACKTLTPGVFRKRTVTQAFLSFAV